MFSVALLGVTVAGCGSSGALQPTPTPRVTSIRATPTRVAAPTSTPAVSAAYRTFLVTLCKAIAARDAGTVQGLLPYYQYNNGVRYGWLGDGEGQTADPSILTSWLAPGTERCRYYTPDVAGHGTVLTEGWPLRGGWNLVEMDTYQGIWKINDFTFGNRASLWQAMQQAFANPLTYHG